QRLRLDAELAGKTVSIRIAAGLEVDGRTRVVEAVCLRHALDPVTEAADLARERPGVIDVAASVQDVDAELPGRRQGLRLEAPLLCVAPEAAEGGEGEGREQRDPRCRADDSVARIALRAGLDRQARETARLVLVE